MVRGSQFHFSDRLAAGRTRMEDERNVIHRPGGMAGWILNYSVEGRGRIGRGAERFAALPGDLLLFAPLAVHDYGRDREAGLWVHLWVYFYPREHWQAWLRWHEVAPGILRLRLADAEARVRIVALFEELIDAVRGASPHAVPLGMSLLEQILIRCAAADPAARSHLDPRVAHAVDWLSARYAESLRLADLARACSLSPSRLAHLFSEQVGMPPLRFLEQLRVNRAREQLVMSGRSIAEVAAAVGFTDPDWFTRVFKRHAGCTPREFLRRSR